MTIPDYIIERLISGSDHQENIEFDSNGNELYHGFASNRATNADAMWAIAKGVYTQITVGTVQVFVMTHVSFLRGQIWDNRASISFP